MSSLAPATLLPAADHLYIFAWNTTRVLNSRYRNPNILAGDSSTFSIGENEGPYPWVSRFSPDPLQKFLATALKEIINDIPAPHCEADSKLTLF